MENLFDSRILLSGHPWDRSIRRQIEKRRQEQIWGTLWEPLRVQIGGLGDQLNEDWNSDG